MIFINKKRQGRATRSEEQSRCYTNEKPDTSKNAPEPQTKSTNNNQSRLDIETTAKKMAEYIEETKNLKPLQIKHGGEDFIKDLEVSLKEIALAYNKSKAKKKIIKVYVSTESVDFIAYQSRGGYKIDDKETLRIRKAGLFYNNYIVCLKKEVIKND